MLPPLSKLSLGDVCPPCTPAPTDAELDAWNKREEELTAEELNRIPPSFNDSRADCSICFEPLRNKVEGSKAVIVAVDIDGACGHAFHKTCLQRWFDQQVESVGDLTCPLCKQPFMDRRMDALYQRVNGRRPPPPPPPPPPAQRVTRNPIRGYETLWEDALEDAGMDDGTNWRLILTATPDRVVIPIPNQRRPDWAWYTYQRFCNKFDIDTRRFTYDQWQQVLKQPERRQNWWLMYYRLMSDLRTVATQAPGAAVAGARAVAGSLRGLARDVNQARAEGAQWPTIMRALLLGEVYEEEDQE